MKILQPNKRRESSLHAACVFRPVFASSSFLFQGRGWNVADLYNLFLTRANKSIWILLLINQTVLMAWRKEAYDWHNLSMQSPLAAVLTIPNLGMSNDFHQFLAHCFLQTKTATELHFKYWLSCQFLGFVVYIFIPIYKYGDRSYL